MSHFKGVSIVDSSVQERLSAHKDWHCVSTYYNRRMIMDCLILLLWTVFILIMLNIMKMKKKLLEIPGAITLGCDAIISRTVVD